jgi:hypothetical protein
MSRNALFCLIAVVACGGEPEPPAAPAEIAPIQVSADQFKSLKWLEGKWRGTLNDTMPFYEEYRFMNDSSIATISYVDSTMKPPKDSGKIELRAGVVANGRIGGERWYVLTAIDSVSAHFEPRGNASNAFTWRRESDRSWIATLGWRGPTGTQNQRIYAMKRLDKTK